MRPYSVVIMLVIVTLAIPATSGQCLPTDTICEFELNVDFKQTMVNAQNTLVYLHNGSLYNYDVVEPDSAEPVPVDDVITADGYPVSNLVVAINGQFPGPAIIVYEGQTVRVSVTNRMFGHVISIHWHGITQRNTPWMDGSGFVTQCPILPGQTFVYEFVADTVGTYFYHNHVGPLGVSGLYGPFIIKERNQQSNIDEHVAVIAEYNHYWSADMQRYKNFQGDYVTGKAFRPYSIDGVRLSRVFFHSGLINGRGRYFDDNGSPIDAPLTVFKVTAGHLYRFRVIDAGYGFPFRVSVDNHTLLLVAADGRDIEPVAVQSFIINNGERFDFILNANQTPGNYFFRAKFLDDNPHHKAEAILRYTGVEPFMPVEYVHECSAEKICKIANCFFPEFPGEEYSLCLDIAYLSDKMDSEAIGLDVQDSEIKEIFLNFGTGRGPSVNYRRFVMPTVNAMAQPNEVSTLCESEVCSPVCFCASSITINSNDIVQLVFAEHGRQKSGVHPLHLHGHKFQVLKIGHYIQNQTNRHFQQENPDIGCNNDFCNVASWSNSSWGGNSIPGLKIRKPVYKDTLTLNSGMYAIVRFKADNPGLWMLHCHMEFHMLGGMAILINESFSDIPEAPPGFPECRPYPGSTGNLNSNNTPVCDGNGDIPTLTEKDDRIQRDKFWIAVGVLGGLAMIEFFVIAVVCGRNGVSTTKYNVKTKSSNMY